MLPSVTVKLTAGAVEDQFILCVSLGFSLFMGFVNNIRTQQPDIGKSFCLWLLTICAKYTTHNIYGDMRNDA